LRILNKYQEFKKPISAINW